MGRPPALKAVCDFAIPDVIFIEEALGLDGELAEPRAAPPAQVVRPAVPPPRSPADRDDQPRPSAAGRGDGLRAAIEAAVRECVERSASPVDLASAAHHVRKVVGYEALTTWAGPGGFKKLVATMQDDTLVLDSAHPGWLRDPARHGPALPAGAPEVAERVSRVVGMPLLSPGSYRALFESVTADGRAAPGESQPSAELVIGEACRDRGQPLTRSAIHFVLAALHDRDVNWRDPERDAGALAAEFAAIVLTLAGNARMELSADERDQISAWIAGDAVAGHESQGTNR